MDFELGQTVTIKLTNKPGTVDAIYRQHDDEWQYNVTFLDAAGDINCRYFKARDLQAA